MIQSVKTSSDIDSIPKRSHKVENIVYSITWLIVIGVCLIYIMRDRSELGLRLINSRVIRHIAETLVPFIILFSINNWLLMPKLLFRNKISLYFTVLIFTLILLWGWQTFHFMSDIDDIHRMPPPHDADGPHPLPPRPRSIIPMPLMLDYTYSIIIIGVNLAMALLFRMIDDRIERERILKGNAENQLKYLKAQINPHFYMNMLNNIHGMIEINPATAQDMVLEMSHLMRYMLYDGSQPTIPLSSEIEFLDNFLHIMRYRYPESKVRITKDFPSSKSCNDIRIPPLLFLVFIENAFKHGISYSIPSFVDVTIYVEGNNVIFKCRNSISSSPDSSSGTNGIGLKNVRERLRLLFEESADLITEIRNDEYYVSLTIPSKPRSKTEI